MIHQKMYNKPFLEIASVFSSSYRMRNAIDKIATSTTVRRIDIKPAVDIHLKAIEYSKKYADNMMLPSILIVIVGVSSFGVNIYRVSIIQIKYLELENRSRQILIIMSKTKYNQIVFRMPQLYITITQVKEIDAVILSVQFVIAYSAFIAGNNYSGQVLMDNSIQIIEEIYNSSWYRIPTKMQKVVLFTFMNCHNLVTFNLAGLFILCSEGLGMMFSSAFSYFTLLCSFQ
ncbi:uncharacterized protein LOC143218061 [Lasioglossum baleicum]|uniref:uncharacterized protein LOC143218061 n=1 Tax=Lasioglossum baleicum TaxID=434251 RepID=UPI003FCD92A4